MYMDYQAFDVDDFLLDEYFLNWVLQPTTESDQFWQTWLAQNPHKQAVVYEARELLLHLHSDDIQVSPERVNRVWHNITSHIEPAKPIWLEAPAEKHLAPAANAGFGFWYRVAAVFIGFAVLGLGFWQYQQMPADTITIATRFGETKKIILPDNSIAILNGSSSLKYAHPWNYNTAREVELDGEAFFSVTHTQNHQKFRVKVSDALRIEVLGTKFTVTDRPTKTRVVLTEGKVKLTYAKGKILGLGTGKVTEAIMQPGEKIELGNTAKVLLKEVVEAPAEYADFQQNKITFRDTPLSEVARLLQDTYGYTVVFAGNSLADKRFTGTSPHNRVDMLLKAIEKSFNLKITQKGNKIMISPK